MRNKALAAPVLAVVLVLSALGSHPAYGAGVATSAERPSSTPVVADSPQAVVDLTTAAGSALVHGTWHYSDAQIVETALLAISSFSTRRHRSTRKMRSAPS